jgi:lipopolysaccharide export system protein LptA
VAATDPLAASGKLQKVDAFGNVVITTPTETVHGDRGVYVPDIGIARLQGNVHITRGPNELTGNEAEVNLKTGVARLISSPGGRVEGLVVPEQGNAPADAGDSIMKGGAPAPAKGRAAPERGRR